MTKKDLPELAKLLIALSEISANKVDVSKEKTILYFQILEDLSFEEIKQNAYRYFQKNKFFPAPSDLRDPDPEGKALQDFEYIRNLLRALYMPELGNSSYVAITEKMKKDGKANLIPLLTNFGIDIINSTSIEATRAQFLKIYKTNINQSRKQIATNKPKKLGEILDDEKLELKK